MKSWTWSVILSVGNVALAIGLSPSFYHGLLAHSISLYLAVRYLDTVPMEVANLTVVWMTNGRTLGKWLTGIRIVSVVHERIGFWHSIERALGYGASLLEAGSGFAQYLVHPTRQTVHDRIAETIVVRLRS